MISTVGCLAPFRKSDVDGHLNHMLEESSRLVSFGMVSIYLPGFRTEPVTRSDRFFDLL